jgi:LCP family protein required for cell wall assembly
MDDQSRQRPPLRDGIVPPGKRPLRRSKTGRVLLIIFLIMIMLLCGGIASAYSSIQNGILTPLSSFMHQVSRGSGEPQTLPAPDFGSISGRAWNILLLGSDNDGKFNFPALLTQVMMIVHIDPDNGSVTLVSIPRDSWVSVPEVGGMHKIDQAYFLGATQHNSFDDGIRLARATVEQDYGITIDRYAWVGLSGFASVIDTLGGVDIDVTHPIVDDTYPDDTGNSTDPFAYRRLYIAPGPQHLDGQQALEYVRSRHADLVGDIGRTNRQQAVLAALKKKLTLVNVVTNLTQLIKDLQGKVYTDLSPEEMLAFANLGRALPDSAVQHLTLGPGAGKQDYGDYANVFDPSAGAEQSVVIPNCANIQPVMNRIFNLGDVQSCKVTGS